MRPVRGSIPPGSIPDPGRVQQKFYSSTLTGGHFLAFLAALAFLLSLDFFLAVLVFGAAVASGVAGVSTGAVTEGAVNGGAAGVTGAFSWAKEAPWRLSRKTPTLANVTSFFMFPHLLKKGLK